MRNEVPRKRICETEIFFHSVVRRLFMLFEPSTKFIQLFGVDKPATRTVRRLTNHYQRGLYGDSRTEAHRSNVRVTSWCQQLAVTVTHRRKGQLCKFRAYRRSFSPVFHPFRPQQQAFRNTHTRHLFAFVMFSTPVLTTRVLMKQCACTEFTISVLRC